MAAPPLLYPFTLGMLAAVNPCGFPLLPAYLEMFVGTAASDERSLPARAGRAVSTAAWATAGFLVLFGGLGVLTQAGWSAVAGHSASASRYVMVGVGVLMLAAGVTTLVRGQLKVRLPALGSGQGRRRPLALAVFGFSYGVASIGCALPLFVTGVSATFGDTGLLRGVAGLCAYGLGMGAVLGGLALGIAVVGRGSARLLRRLSRWVPVVGGALLTITGAYLIWYWVSDIAWPGHSFALQRAVTRVQVAVASPLDDHAFAVGALLGVALIAAVVAGGRAERGTAGPKAPR